MIQKKFEWKKYTNFSNDKQNDTPLASTSNIDKCYFCGEDEDHVATKDPKSTQLVQYFFCKKFADMTSGYRFQGLRREEYKVRNKGAQQSTGKHSNGKCHRDHICKHRSHHKYPTNEHDLVRHEHRGNSGNDHKYTDRCIMKQQIQQPTFVKKLKLTFHSNQNQLSTYQHSLSKQGAAIYILQTIKMGKQLYSLFSDTGCCGMVFRYQAVKSISLRAIKERPGTISIAGVENSQI